MITKLDPKIFYVNLIFTFSGIFENNSFINFFYILAFIFIKCLKIIAIFLHSF